MATEIGGVGGLSVYITQYSGRSVCFFMVTVSFGGRECLQKILLFVWPRGLRGRRPFYFCFLLVCIALWEGLV